MNVHLSEQEKFLVLENKTASLSSASRQHFLECTHCQVEIRNQQEMDITLSGLTPQKLNDLVSKKITELLLSKALSLKLMPIVIAVSIIFIITIIFMGRQAIPVSEPVGFNYESISEKSVEWIKQTVNTPMTLWKGIRWSGLQQALLWLFQPDTARIFFILIVLGLYALIDLHIRQRFFH